METKKILPIVIVVVVLLVAFLLLAALQQPPKPSGDGGITPPGTEPEIDESDYLDDVMTDLEGLEDVEIETEPAGVGELGIDESDNLDDLISDLESLE